MALTKAAIVQGAAQEAKGILGAVPGLAADAAAQYVKQGTPSGLIPNLGVALARQACRRHAQQPNLAPDRVSRGLERVCRPYLDDIGYGQGPALAVPFRGGQCAGVLYTVFFEYNLIATDGSTIEPAVQAQSNAQGPISGIRGEGSPAFQNIVIDSGLGPDFARTGSCQQGCYRNIKLKSIVRADGQPDTCGNKPTVYTPPTTPPGPVITVEPIIVIPILDVDADVTINVDGTIDIDVDGVEVNIDPFADAPEGGGGVAGGDLVPGEGLAGSPADTGNGGTAGGDAPPGQELVGVRVEVLEAPVGFNQYANNSAVIYRGVGYVRMGYPGKLALDVGGSALISPQFFIAPVRGLTSWEVRANLGFINRVTPFYRALPS